MAQRTASGSEKPAETPPETAPVAPAEPAKPAADAFPRVRVFDRSEGPRIVGEIPSLGRLPKYHEIVGALSGDDSESFTRDELVAKVEAFRAIPLNLDGAKG